MDMDDDGLELLSEEECRQLLSQGSLGRVAVAVGAIALVFPVNYLMSGDDVLFWTAEGTKLRAAVDNRVVTFEVDHVDAVTETGWSVLAVGPAQERAEPAVVAGAMAAGLRSWAPGDRSHLVAISAEILTGRRIGPSPHRSGQTSTAAGWMVGPHSPISTLAQRPLRVDPGLSLGAVADLMHNARLSSVIVGGGTAIITRWDLAGALRAHGSDACVTSASGAEGIVVDEDLSVIETAARMLRHEIRHVVVCDGGGRVVGLVGLHDLVRILIDAMDPTVWVMLRRTMLTAHGATSGGRQPS
jgi:CBS domain-containing protein/nitroimidazol reductase NimA-like FMN-containing flavoprotein (pyridoxamine 5'-phosphate oxidase superfamily)